MRTIAVDVPESDLNYIVIVENAESEIHARLAAYYHIYGTETEPSINRLRELTREFKSGGISNAKIYRNPYGSEDL